MFSSQPSISIVATFPPAFFLENIVALRDDTLLITVANRKCIYAIPPPAILGQPRQPQLLHQFPDHAWAMGIASALDNASLIYTLTTDFLDSDSHFHWLWTLDTSNVAAGFHPKKLVQFPPAAKGLNGLTPLADNVLLAADSFAGCIWRIDVEMGENGVPVDAKVTEWMKDPAFAGKLILPDFQPGVNGLKYSKATNCLCFSSTQQHLFGIIPVDPKTWTPSGAPKVLVTGPQGDDMIIDDEFQGGPVVYLTTHRDNSIIRIPLRQENNANVYEAVAEVLQNDTRVLGPTSGVWKHGNAGKTAYFCADGGLKHPLSGEPPHFARILQVDF